MPDKVYNITADADDGYVDDFGLYATAYFCKVGNDYTPNHAFFRFNTVDIPAGSEITSAVLRLTAYGGKWYDDIDLVVHAVDADNPAAPTTLTEFNALGLTTGTAWHIAEGWTSGVEYDSVDITDDVQAVIDRTGWAEDNSLMIVVKDAGTAQYYWKEPSGWKWSSGAYSAELLITYAAGETSSAGSADGAEGTTIKQGLSVADQTGANGYVVLDMTATAGDAIGAEGTTVRQGLEADESEGIHQIYPHDVTVDYSFKSGIDSGAYGEIVIPPPMTLNCCEQSGVEGSLAGSIIAGEAVGAFAAVGQSFFIESSCCEQTGASGESAFEITAGESCGTLGSISRDNVIAVKAAEASGAVLSAWHNYINASAGEASGAKGASEVDRIINLKAFESTGAVGSILKNGIVSCTAYEACGAVGDIDIEKIVSLVAAEGYGAIAATSSSLLVITGTGTETGIDTTLLRHVRETYA